MKESRILIFSATFGAGHISAAEALIAVLQVKKPSAHIIHLDFGEFLGKTFNKVVKSTYLEMIKHTPKLWGKFYYHTSKIPAHSAFQRFLNKLGRSKFLECVNLLQPDIIICTYPTIAGILAQLRTEQILNVPLVTIVTDYAVHSQWIHDGVDLYLVGCEEVNQGLIERGINPGRIKVTGIPVNPKFSLRLDRRRIAEKFDLDPDWPTVLIMGGAYGVLESLNRICAMTTHMLFPVQTVVVCGRDEKLFNSLDTVVAASDNPIRRFGFVHNVEELMTVSDLIITKAGGITVSEALTKQLPLVIYRPIPGQEEENAGFISKNGAGRVVETEEELIETVTYLLQHPAMARKIGRVGNRAIPKKTAARAVEEILELLHMFQTASKTG